MAHQIDDSAAERLGEALAHVRQRQGVARGRTGPAIAILVIGVGLLAAPFIFQMLGGENRAPEGGKMIEAFRPFMTQERLSDFDGFLDQIDAAEAEARTVLVPAVSQVQPAPEAALRRVATFSDHWRGENGIFADMDEMVATITANIANFEAVDALPPFSLFPFFFIMPGLILAGLAFALLRRLKVGRPAGGARKALVVMGAGLIAAPFIFQMMGGDNRAFKGKDMINDFKPIMTEEKISTIQRYFLDIGPAEGAMRADLIPLARSQSPSVEFPAVASLSEQWPHISSELAEFLGAMVDNLDRYSGVKALPPFSLFPFFFILPGLLVAGLALSAGRPATGRA